MSEVTLDLYWNEMQVGDVLEFGQYRPTVSKRMGVKTYFEDGGSIVLPRDKRFTVVRKPAATKLYLHVSDVAKGDVIDFGGSEFKVVYVIESEKEGHFTLSGGFSKGYVRLHKNAVISVMRAAGTTTFRTRSSKGTISDQG